MQDTAVLLLAYGGPNSLKDIEPYLLDVRGGRATPPELVAEIRERYALIGGKSPLLEITNEVANQLEILLNTPGISYKAFVGMRHWHPYITETVKQIQAQGFNKLVAICMTPFESRMSSDVYFQHLDRAICEVQQQEPGWQPQIVSIPAWYADPKFVAALAELVKEGLKKIEEPEQVMTVFTAHSLPASVLEHNDPYHQQFQELAALVAKDAGLADDRWTWAYQSAGHGRIPWLGPSLEEKLAELKEQGEEKILVSSIGFLSDHVEVLYDLDIETQELAQELGIQLTRMETLNSRPEFIAALADIIQKELKYYA